MTITVVLVDDHAVFAETLAMALSRVSDIEVVGTAHTAVDAIDLVRALRPDVAMVDAGLPDFSGVEVAARLPDVSAGTKVVILTASTDVGLLSRALEAKVSGYLMKQASLTEVTQAIRSAHAGAVTVPLGVIDKVVAAARTPDDGVGSDLTRRELDVLALLAEGYDVRRVSEVLSISWNTTRSYVKTLLVKLGAHSQLEAVTTALRLGIVKRSAAEP